MDCLLILCRRRFNNISENGEEQTPSTKGVAVLVRNEMLTRKFTTAPSQSVRLLRDFKIVLSSGRNKSPYNLADKKRGKTGNR